MKLVFNNRIFISKHDVCLLPCVDRVESRWICWEGCTFSPVHPQLPREHFLLCPASEHCAWWSSAWSPWLGGAPFCRGCQRGRHRSPEDHRNLNIFVSNHWRKKEVKTKIFKRKTLRKHQVKCWSHDIQEVDPYRPPVLRKSMQTFLLCRFTALIFSEGHLHGSFRFDHFSSTDSQWLRHKQMQK